MKILLDTNFIMIPFTLKIDIFSLFREKDPRTTFSILDRSIEELKYLTQKGTKKDSEAAKMAIQACQKLNISIITTEPGEESFKNVDQVLVSVAEKKGFSVATQDKELQKELKKAGVAVYFLRQKKYIQEI